MMDGTSGSRRICADDCKSVKRKSFATSYRGPWRLIYYETYLEEVDALGREEYLKSGGGRQFLKTQLKHHLKMFPLRQTA